MGENVRRCDHESWLRKKGISANEIYHEKLERLKKLSAGKIILDEGCGMGIEASEIAGTAAAVFGIELDKRDLLKAGERARSKGGQNVNLLVASAEELPFGDSVFEVVYNCWVIEHIEKPEKMISESYRVLSPGGIMILWVPNVFNITCIITKIIPLPLKVKLLELLLRRKEVSRLPCYYRANSVRKLDGLCKGRFRRSYLKWSDSPPYFFKNRILLYIWYARHLLSRFRIFGWMKTDFRVEYEKV